MSENTRINLISVLIGLGTGLFMSILVLYMMIADYFEIKSLAFVLTLTAASALPLCLSFLRAREYNVFLAQIVMILTSFIITVIYGVFVTYAGELSTSYSSLWIQVLQTSAIVHGVSLAVSGIAEWSHRKRMKV